jgi:Tfp pilus assembly protein PilX
MQRQKGFVLISVLIITTIATMLAFSQLSDNRLQERIAGNQQKEINARLAAEKGIFDAFEAIKMGTSSSAITTELDHLSATNESGYTLQDILWNGSETDGTFSFVSKGIFYDAETYLQTAINSKLIGIFDEAIIACESVTVGGTAIIDSYSGGPYSATTVDANGNVSAIGGINNVIYSDRDSIQGNISEYFGDCDPLGIETKMTGIVNAGGITRTNFAVSDDFTDGNVYFYDNFHIQNHNVLITGDVTFYITGNMTAKNTTFSLANDTSSLTIYIEGKMAIDTGSNIFANKYAAADAIPLTVYSSNKMSDAVTLAGNGQIYMNLYAPFGDVAYNGNAGIMGALRGKNVAISGTGGLHYDEGLAGIGDSGAPRLVSYSAVYYYYP